MFESWRFWLLPWFSATYLDEPKVAAGRAVLLLEGNVTHTCVVLLLSIQNRPRRTGVPARTNQGEGGRPGLLLRLAPLRAPAHSQC